MIYIFDYRRQFAFLAGPSITHLDGARELPADATGILCHWNNFSLGPVNKCAVKDLLSDGLHAGKITYPVVFFAGDCGRPVSDFKMGERTVRKYSRDELAKRITDLVGSRASLLSGQPCTVDIATSLQADPESIQWSPSISEHGLSEARIKFGVKILAWDDGRWEVRGDLRTSASGKESDLASAQKRVAAVYLAMVGPL